MKQVHICRSYVQSGVVAEQNHQRMACIVKLSFQTAVVPVLEVKPVFFNIKALVIASKLPLEFVEFVGPVGAGKHLSLQSTQTHFQPSCPTAQS